MSNQPGSELAVLDIPRLSIGTIKSQLEDIQQMMKDVMVVDTHYGKIPGCGDKFALLKPGAEKICLMFRLIPSFKITKCEYPEGHREYEVICTLSDPRGNIMGQGVGLCSTMETKYKYRDGGVKNTGTPLPGNYWDVKKQDELRARELIGGKGFKHYKDEDTGLWYIGEITTKVENPNIADTYNTVLKMAKKRAQVDAAITTTAAGDIFTQDQNDKEDDDEADTVAKVDEKTSVLKNKSTQRVIKGKTDDGKYTYKIDKDDIEYRTIIKEAGGQWQGKPLFYWLCPGPVAAFEESQEAPNA